MTGQEHYIEQIEERVRRLEIVTELAVCPDCHSRSAGSYVMGFVPCGHRFHQALIESKPDHV